MSKTNLFILCPLHRASNESKLSSKIPIIKLDTIFPTSIVGLLPQSISGVLSSVDCKKIQTLKEKSLKYVFMLCISNTIPLPSWYYKFYLVPTEFEDSWSGGAVGIMHKTVNGINAYLKLNAATGTWSIGKI